MSAPVTRLHQARQEMRRAVLAAMLADYEPDFAAKFDAWKAVDDAAIAVAAARRRYDRHVRDLTKRANLAAGDRL
jgi:hypothetical protein